MIILPAYYALFSEGDIGTTLYEWHSPISSKKLDFGTYHEKVLTLEDRISDNFSEDEPCLESSHEATYYKVIMFHRNKLLLGVFMQNYIPCSA